MKPRIYLDHAATSRIKPPAVLEAVVGYMRDNGASAGRGAYREALAIAQTMRQCRDRFNRLIHGQDPNHCIFTLNCSDALNLAIKGVLRPGDHVVTTAMDHNSVLRPLSALEKRLGLKVTHVLADPATASVNPADVRAAITPQTRLVALVHASNVSGTLLPIAEVGEICRKAGIIFLVDAAQSCGHVPLDVQAMNMDLLAVPGHKGLLGPSGTGFLYVRPGLEDRLETLKEGGTGSVSENPYQPDTLPDKYEQGSHNAIGIAGLNASLGWILERGVETIWRHDAQLCERFLQELQGVEGLTIFGPGGTHDPLEISNLKSQISPPLPRVGVFSVRLEGYTPHELAAVLESEFGILTRAGLHCAPFAHRTLGTLNDGGTTRFSFSAFTTPEDVSAATGALKTLAGVNVTVG